jgi:hypothetical protein
MVKMSNKAVAFTRNIAICNSVNHGANYLLSLAFLFSHGWFATPHDVLHADWQEVWHSPQPPFFVLSLRSRVLIVFILFI